MLRDKSYSIKLEVGLKRPVLKNHASPILSLIFVLMTPMNIIKFHIIVKRSLFLFESYPISAVGVFKGIKCWYRFPPPHYNLEQWL